MTLRKSHVSLQRLPPAINYGWGKQQWCFSTNNDGQFTSSIGVNGIKCLRMQIRLFYRQMQMSQNKLVCTDMFKCNCCKDSLEAYDNDDDDFDYDSDNSDGD